jgi:hypothetical protein
MARQQDRPRKPKRKWFSRDAVEEQRRWLSFEGETQWGAPCSSCVRSTVHEILFKTTRESDNALEHYMMLSCAGCGTISMMHWFINTSIKDDDGRAVLLSPARVRHYPSPVTRKMPEWVSSRELSNVVRRFVSLLEEIYQAVDGGQHRLAAMGVRALLEQVMIAEIGDIGGFDKKLDAFQEAGLISSRQREAMRATLDVGDAAMHRAHTPDKTELNTCLDIAEGVMSAIYAQREAVEKLVRRVPPRENGRGRAAKPKKS